MKVDRQTFLRQVGGAMLGVLAVGAVRGAEASSDAGATLPAYRPEQSEAFWRAVWAEYPLADDPLYLNTGGLGPAPRRVLATVNATMTALQEHAETGHALLEPARDVVARFMGAAPEEVCFVRNATEGNSIIAGGLDLKAGDEVIFDSHAHPGGSFPWLNQAKRRGIVVRLFEPDPTSAEANLSRIFALITPRTRVIQVSHVTCTTGLLFPVAAIAAEARRRGCWFHVDGAQAVGVLPVDMAAIGCDSYACSGHKWLGGPHETGILFIRRDRLDAVELTEAGAYSGDLPSLPGTIHYSPTASRHEYGTRNAGLIAGLAEAVRFQTQIGPARIAAHGRELAAHLNQDLRKLPGVEVLTPSVPELRSAITTIRHERASADRLYGYLMEAHRLRCRPVTEQGLNAVRISTHVFNSHADTERVIAAVRASLRDL